MTAELERHALGLTWTERRGMGRTAHALVSDGRVWLVDPFDDQPALEAARGLGTAEGVLQLLDRHNRDCATLAGRLDVPLMRLPRQTPGTPFEVVPILSLRAWKEVALWWPDRRALVVAEAIGTAPAFAAGRRAGIHPMLRLTPPRSQLTAHRPELLLVGHGKPVLSAAASAIDEALEHARSDIPRMLTKLPALLHG
jgi:hypothetical protein